VDRMHRNATQTDLSGQIPRPTPASLAAGHAAPGPAACATPHVQRTGEATTTPKILPHHIRTQTPTACPERLATGGRAARRGPRLHGFNDYRRGFEETANSWQPGFIAYAYDQRGFGGTPHARLWFGGEAMAEDARTVSALLRRRYPGLPSTSSRKHGRCGGPGRRERDLPIDGLVLLAPAVWGRSTMPALQRGALWFGSHTFPPSP